MRSWAQKSLLTKTNTRYRKYAARPFYFQRKSHSDGGSQRRQGTANSDPSWLESGRSALRSAPTGEEREQGGAEATRAESRDGRLLGDRRSKQSSLRIPTATAQGGGTRPRRMTANSARCERKRHGDQLPVGFRVSETICQNGFPLGCLANPSA